MDHQLTWGNSGNISAKSSDNSFHITKSGTFLGELNLNSFCEVNIHSGIVIGEGKASKEVPMHQVVYENREEINVVLHCSPYYSTLLSCLNLEIPNNIFIENMYYLEKLARVPYCPPGSNELGEEVRKVVHEANIILLENHGVLVFDTSFEEARNSLHTLELSCRMTLDLLKLESKIVSPINETTRKRFLTNGNYKPKRNWLE